MKWLRRQLHLTLKCYINVNTVDSYDMYLRKGYTNYIFKLQSYLLGIVLCPLRRAKTMGPKSEWGSLFLLTPLIPLHTSIMVNLVEPLEPGNLSKKQKNKRSVGIIYKHRQCWWHNIHFNPGIKKYYHAAFPNPNNYWIPVWEILTRRYPDFGIPTTIPAFVFFYKQLYCHDF